MFRIEFRTGNAVFGDGPGLEIAEILRRVADRVADGVADGDSYPVRDENSGTVIGRVDYSEE